LGHAVFFGGEGPEVVGSADFFFGDEVVVDKTLIYVDDSVLCWIVIPVLSED
jgi:hypothetical protein